MGVKITRRGVATGGGLGGCDAPPIIRNNKKLVKFLFFGQRNYINII